MAFKFDFFDAEILLFNTISWDIIQSQQTLKLFRRASSSSFSKGMPYLPN